MSYTLKISNGDVVNNKASGRPDTVSDAIKLRQDIIEFFNIQVLPNGFGAGLDQLIGLTEIGAQVYTSMADRQIRDGLQEFISLQKSDSRIPRLPEERIVNITGLLIEQDPTDPTKYVFTVNFITEDGQAKSMSMGR